MKFYSQILILLLILSIAFSKSSFRKHQKTTQINKTHLEDDDDDNAPTIDSCVTKNKADTRNINKLASLQLQGISDPNLNSEEFLYVTIVDNPDEYNTYFWHCVKQAVEADGECNLLVPDGETQDGVDKQEIYQQAQQCYSEYEWQNLPAWYNFVDQQNFEDSKSVIAYFDSEIAQKHHKFWECLRKQYTQTLEYSFPSIPVKYVGDLKDICTKDQGWGIYKYVTQMEDTLGGDQQNIKDIQEYFNQNAPSKTYAEQVEKWQKCVQNTFEHPPRPAFKKVNVQFSKLDSVCADQYGWNNVQPWQQISQETRKQNSPYFYKQISQDTKNDESGFWKCVQTYFDKTYPSSFYYQSYNKIPFLKSCSDQYTWDDYLNEEDNTYPQFSSKNPSDQASLLKEIQNYAKSNSLESDAFWKCAESQTASGGSNIGLIAGIAGGAVVLVGGGVGGFLLYRKKKNQKKEGEGEEEEKANEDQKKDEEGGDNKKAQESRKGSELAAQAEKSNNQSHQPSEIEAKAPGSQAGSKLNAIDN